MNSLTQFFAILSVALTINAGVVTPFAMQVEIYSSQNPGKFCWKKSYGRGVGTIPTRCSGGKDYENGLCYTPCKSGYSGNGPLCLQNCPSGYANHPLSCYKNLLKWFFKKSYGRGVGTIPTSCGNRDYDAGLCYNKCKAGYNGVGPVCWKTCTGNASTDCGAACATNTDVCVAKIFEQIVSVLQVAENIAEMVLTAGGATALKASAKAALQTFFKTAQAAIAKGATKEAFIKLAKTLAVKAGASISESVAEKAYTKAATGSDFKWEDFSALDPTGIADVVIAFTNEIC